MLTVAMTAQTEIKGIRRVRTPEGAAHFGQPIGTIIVRDLLPDIGTRTKKTKVEDLEPGHHIMVKDQVRKVLSTQRDDENNRIILELEAPRTKARNTESKKKGSILKRVIAGIGLLAVAGGLAYGPTAAVSLANDDNDTSITQQDDSRVDKLKPAKPAPTTAKGFQKMWDTQVDVKEWGGGDVGASVKMDDGRSVWFFGDTMSENNFFVNSTAITQDGGNLYVSNGGKQLLPEGGFTKDGDKIVYWIEGAKNLGGNEIQVTAAPTRIGKDSVWDFSRHKKESRTATVSVDKFGNVDFEKWTGYVDAPPIDETLYDLPGENHFAYSKQTHSQFVLENGKPLVTYAQNWDNQPGNGLKKNPDGSIDYKGYRLVFTDDGKLPQSDEGKSLFVTLTTETKVRRVATPAGVDHFDQPLGSIIVADGVLKNLLFVDSFDSTYDEYEGNEEFFYVTKKPQGKKKEYIALDANDKEIARGTDIEEVLKQVDERSAATGKPAKNPVASTVPNKPSTGRTTRSKTPAAPKAPSATPKASKPVTVADVTKNGEPAWMSSGKKVPARVGAGEEQGHFYRDSDGKLAVRGMHRPESLEEVVDFMNANGLRVPPEWDELWLADDPSNARVMVKGVNTSKKTGRQTFAMIQNPSFTASQQAEKYERVKTLSKALPKLDKTLDREAMDDETAAVVMIMRRTGMRVSSSDKAVGAERAYGASSLEARHVRPTKNGVTFSFIAKKGVKTTLRVPDPELRDVMEKWLEGKDPKEPLFPDASASGTIRYLRDNTGMEVKNHDLRTHLATTSAAEQVAQYNPPKNEKEFTQLRNQIGDTVSARLGNNRSEALKSYIAPEVFMAWGEELGLVYIGENKWVPASKA